eukprot:3056201-Prymnesium_polylepis.1
MRLCFYVIRFLPSLPGGRRDLAYLTRMTCRRPGWMGSEEKVSFWRTIVLRSLAALRAFTASDMKAVVM